MGSREKETTGSLDGRDQVRAGDEKNLEKTGEDFDVGHKSSPWLPHGSLEGPATYVESM